MNIWAKFSIWSSKIEYRASAANVVSSDPSIGFWSIIK